MSTRSETLKMMGVYSCPIDYDNNHQSVFPFVQWDKVGDRINKHPEEAVISPMPCPPLQFGLVNDSSPIPAHIVDAFIKVNPISLQQFWYKISVIAICQNKKINGDVLQLLLSKGPKESLIPSVRKTLIAFAIESENIEVVKVLVDHFPWVLSEKSGPNSELPLHSCVDKDPKLLSLLLQEGIRSNVGGQINVVGGLFLKNDFDVTFYDNLILALVESDLDDKKSRLQKWKRLEVCIHYANLVRTGIISSFLYNFSQLSFSCIGFIPFHLIDEALDILDLEYETSDIYSLIEMATTDDEWAIRLGLDSPKLIKILSLMLQRQNNLPDQPLVCTCRGNPLHYGAFRGLPWEGGLKEILKYDYSSLMKIDKRSGLSSFMAAASGSSYELDSIYELLKSDPFQVDLEYY